MKEKEFTKGDLFVCAVLFVLTVCIIWETFTCNECARMHARYPIALSKSGQ